MARPAIGIADAGYRTFAFPFRPPRQRIRRSFDGAAAKCEEYGSSAAVRAWAWHWRRGRWPNAMTSSSWVACRRLDTAREQLRYERVRTAVADIGHEGKVAALFEPCGPLDHIVSTAADIDNAYQLLPSLQVEAALRVVDSTFIDPLWLAQQGAPAQQ
jgi:hypothetical protein